MLEKLEKNSFIENGYISASRKTIAGGYSRHWHEFFEIEYIISGTGRYVVDGEVFDIVPGMTFFMTPACFHDVSLERAEIFNIMFVGNCCNPLFLSELCQNAPFRTMRADAPTRMFLESVMGELVKNIPDTPFASSLLDCIVAKLRDDDGRSMAKPLSVSRQAQLYILSNFRSGLTLEKTAAHVGFTPAYLSTVFKAETGMTFKSYLNSLRFEYAQKLLRFSDLSITQICAECGFNDYANFIRRFKARFGVSPGQYRG